MTLIQSRLQRFLKAHPQCKKIGVWGQGEVCNIVLATLPKIAPWIRVLGVTDSFYEGETVPLANGAHLMSVKNLLDKRPDGLVIASIKFEDKIRASISELQSANELKICSLTHYDLNFSKQPTSVIDEVFLWPDRSVGWERLADKSENPEHAELYRHVAELLKLR